ncbi:hypothetical protein M758_3G266200 [Ceratodon purpureus]|nr:hypothetical protein M758_3G266200 [Ceratodon purpureus]
MTYYRCFCWWLCPVSVCCSLQAVSHLPTCFNRIFLQYFLVVYKRPVQNLHHLFRGWLIFLQRFLSIIPCDGLVILISNLFSDAWPF